MKVINEELVQIKKTKSVEMCGNSTGVSINIYQREPLQSSFQSSIYIPMSKVPQVMRGLFSAMQRFWRKHEKKANRK